MPPSQTLDACAPSLMTRTEIVRLEGQEAAEKRMDRHDNPYRATSADGLAWHEGFDTVAAPTWRQSR